MDEQENLEQLLELLGLAGTAQAASELLDIPKIARERGMSERAVREQLAHLENLGLLFGLSDEDQEPPILPEAGKQYLARRGDVPRDVLRFLSRQVDDLNAREALLAAGTILVDEFRDNLLHDHAKEYAEGLVPPAFEQAVTERLALDLFAAAVALLTRLSDARPAGCVAEEILAVALIEQAKVHLEMRADLGQLTEIEAADAAEAATSGLFDLFQDDDVLALFEMSEPSDAAVMGHSPISREMGVTDQRLESWFKPFTWTIPTGYLGR
ncbi:MAG: hypothetical protein JWN10_1710 [Solirubrobacterales bacterium]|nr:hypothetical protein [Solirubrobacterales bacterium]